MSGGFKVSLSAALFHACCLLGLCTALLDSAVPDPRAVVRSSAAVVTVLTEGLFRVQRGVVHDDNRPSYQVVNRRTPVPDFVATHSGENFSVSTKLANITITETAPFVKVTCDAAAREWSYDPKRDPNHDPLQNSTPINNLGMYVLDDSTTARLGGGDATNIDWWEHPTPGAVDIYIMCYGIDYDRGMKAFTTITGSPRLLPLAAYGVWYSGCCIDELYTQSAVSEKVLAPYRQLDLPLDFFVFDFFWHRKSTGWAGYSFDNKSFPDWARMLEEFRLGTNSYGSPLKVTNNIHPNDYTITPLSEDNYAGFAQAMGYSPKAQMSFPCDFYNRSYMQALQDQLLSRVEDYPWVDCSCSSRGCCSGSANKTGSDLQPYNLDFQLHTNYAFDAMYAKQNRRSITLNRVPGRGDGTNYDDVPLNGICNGFGGCLRGSLGAHRYPAAWTGDIGDDPAHLVNSISLFPAACAGYLWCAYSVDLGPYSDSLSPSHPINTARYIRYMQWGVFSAIFRPHDGGNADTRIWTFPQETFHILRDLTRLRGAITPWVYALAAESKLQSWPFCRPMWYDYAAEAKKAGKDAYNMKSQYMFGDVLVRPIAEFVAPGNAQPPFNASTDVAVNTSQYSVWIPSGCWHTWNGSATFCGPLTLQRSALIGEVPAFVKSGAILPMWPPGRRSTSPAQRTRVWTLWVGESPSDGAGADHEDDGESLLGDRSVTNVRYEYNGILTVNIGAPDGNYEGAAASKAHALQIRAGVRHHLDASNVTCSINGRAPQHLRPGVVGDYVNAGYWVVLASNAEMAAPAGSIVVVCPAVTRQETLRITVPRVALKALAFV